jgi:PAS domain-containing protein
VSATDSPPLTIDPRLRVVLDAMPARVSLLDRAQIHRYANADYAQLAGRPISEILGRSAADILGSAAYEALRADSERALAGETVRWEG